MATWKMLQEAGGSSVTMSKQLQDEKLIRKNLFWEIISFIPGVENGRNPKK